MQRGPNYFYQKYKDVIAEATEADPVLKEEIEKATGLYKEKLEKNPDALTELVSLAKKEVEDYSQELKQVAKSIAGESD